MYSLSAGIDSSLESIPEKVLLLLVSIFSETLLTLVRCHFVLLSFFSAWHKSDFTPLRPRCALDDSFERSQGLVKN